MFVLSLKAQISGGRWWPPPKGFLCVACCVFLYNYIYIFYRIIMFCLSCELISPNWSDWFSLHRHNNSSLSPRVDMHPESKSGPCTICQSSSNARQSCVCLYVCGWMGFNAYVHVCLTGFVYIFNFVYLFTNISIHPS